MFDAEPFDTDPFENRWKDYLGCRNGMVYFTHGAYRLTDIVAQMYPNPEDPRRSLVLMKFSSTT
jgi:hypothetical protein